MPDIIGFQEVDQKYEEFWKQRLDVLGYDVKGFFRPGTDGCAVAWKRDTLSIKEYKEVDFAT